MSILPVLADHIFAVESAVEVEWFTCLFGTLDYERPYKALRALSDGYL
jgi:hypothetical protein